MLILPIEKEIETEHKVLGRFTARQVICGGAIIACVVVFYLMLKDLFWVLLCTMPFLFVFGMIGWYTKYGLHLEDLALKKLQVQYYRNEIRRYRTKNYYFALLNAAYAKQRNSNTEKSGKQKKEKKR